MQYDEFEEDEGYEWYQVDEENEMDDGAELSPQIQELRDRLAKRSDPVWLRSPEGVAFSLREVKRLEQLHRRAVDTMPAIHPEVGVRHAIYAELLQVHSERGDAAFIEAYTDRSPGSSWERLQTSFEATTEREKVGGDTEGKGGYWEHHQGVEDVTMPGFFIPPPKSPRTYQEYLDRFEGEKQEGVTLLSQVRDMLGKRTKGKYNVYISEAQTSTPVPESVWTQSQVDQQMRETVAGMLSERSRREQMTLLTDRIDWIITKVKGRRYDSLKALCKDFRMPLIWGRAVKAFVVGSGRMSEQEWSRSLGIKRGRPAAPKVRGPYKKRI